MVDILHEDKKAYTLIRSEDDWISYLKEVTFQWKRYHVHYSQPEDFPCLTFYIAELETTPVCISHHFIYVSDMEVLADEILSRKDQK